MPSSSQHPGRLGRLVEIREEAPAGFVDYARISIGFTVDVVFEVLLVDEGLGGFRFVERAVPMPYLKDYDAIAGNHPTEWPARFDTSTWGVLSGRYEGRRVGGAVVALNREGIRQPEQRTDAELWDLRVSPEFRRRGIARALFVAAETWARARGCTQLSVETQNINVAACKFYQSQGCSLVAVRRFAYADLPHEIQLCWSKDLSDDQSKHYVRGNANDGAIIGGQSKMSGTPAFAVRRPTTADRDGWINMRMALWPDCPRTEQEREVDATLASATHTALVAASADGELCGFVEATLREFAMGCTTKPIGYVEGWYVQPRFHLQGIGRALMNAVEQWAIEKGCQEMASDTTIGNAVSDEAHRALGYEESGRLICFRKSLVVAH